MRGSWLVGRGFSPCPRQKRRSRGVTMESYDAVIIGAGPNALVNAAYRTKAGWIVLILDRNDRPGGGLRTDELTLPGFVHDVYAGFLVLFAISQAFADLGKELSERGLTMANS